jgi:beta-fructofuranosidase
VKLADGKLVLGKNAVLISARSEKAATAFVAAAIKKFPLPYKPTTPTMPDPMPGTWLTYHLAHPGPDKAIPADPNCAIYYKRRYHLFYIYQSHGHSFAHVSSTDMVNWKWHVTTLTPPKTGHGMFSGTAFVTADGKPAIIYHGQGTNRNQIAFALDDNLENWSKPVAVEPMTKSGDPARMRHWDPDCWRIDDDYYALGGGSNPTLAKSTDLKKWEFLGEFFHPDFPKDLGVKKGEDTSCANMFRIGNKWMLLCISHGLGCRYYLGDFKDGKYLPDHHAMMNWARWDFFAPESLLTPDGRRVMWAWCTPWVNGMQKVGRPMDFEALMKDKIQPGIQSLPRELSLPKDGVLRIKPLRELEALRSETKQQKQITVKSDSSHTLKDIAGDTMELEIVFTKPAASEFGLKVLCGKDGSKGFTIASGKASKALTVGYIKPPFELSDGEDLTLRVFIDKNMVEVFANDRQAAVAWHEYEPQDIHVSLFSKGGDIELKSVSAWKMKSIYDGDN